MKQLGYLLLVMIIAICGCSKEFSGFKKAMERSNASFHNDYIVVYGTTVDSSFFNGEPQVLSYPMARKLSANDVLAGKVETIDVNETDSVFEDFLYNFENLKDLSVYYINSKLYSIDFNRLPKLQSLYIDVSFCDSLFADHFNNTSVKKVSIFMCSIKTLCSGFEGFHGLNYFYISYCPEVNIECDFSRFELLDTVGIGECCLTEFPKGLEKCKKLKYVDLSLNCIDSIPDEFGSLPDLNYYYLSFNAFTTVPKAISILEKRGIYGMLTISSPETTPNVNKQKLQIILRQSGLFNAKKHFEIKMQEWRNRVEN